MNLALLSRRETLLTNGIFVTGLSPHALAADPPQDEPNLIFRTDNSRNAEPGLNKLVESWLTPTKHFYRSHAANSAIDPTAFRLQWYRQPVEVE